MLKFLVISYDLALFFNRLHVAFFQISVLKEVRILILLIPKFQNKSALSYTSQYCLNFVLTLFSSTGIFFLPRVTIKLF